MSSYILYVNNLISWHSYILTNSIISFLSLLNKFTTFTITLYSKGGTYASLDHLSCRTWALSFHHATHIFRNVLIISCWTMQHAISARLSQYVRSPVDNFILLSSVNQFYLQGLHSPYRLKVPPYISLKKNPGWTHRCVSDGTERTRVSNPTPCNYLWSRHHSHGWFKYSADITCHIFSVSNWMQADVMKQTNENRSTSNCLAVLLAPRQLDDMWFFFHLYYIYVRNTRRNLKHKNIFCMRQGKSSSWMVINRVIVINLDDLQVDTYYWDFKERNDVFWRKRPLQNKITRVWIVLV